jgi:AraC-like DNA-binding protein
MIPATTATNRVLTLDDEVLIRAAVAALLRVGGFHVDGQAAADGGWAVLPTEHPTLDTVLTEVGTPGPAGVVGLAAAIESVVADELRRGRSEAGAYGTVRDGRSDLAARIEAFIGGQLSDPDLSPAKLAAAHHVSVRCLHRVFQAKGTSVSATIRRGRLERCRRDLIGTDDPIHRIALRWGFRRAADFSRAFRAMYAVTPREYRQRNALGRPVAAG